MKIIRAKHLGMCFGVRDAVSLALSSVERGPITIYGDLVHNETVLANLRQKGVSVEREAARVKTSEVLITAHGASQRTINALRSQGLAVGEATCPLVHHAHRMVQNLVRENYHPVIVGLRDHVEVRGIIEDLAEFDVILTEADVARMAFRPRFGVVSQTTQPLERVQHLVQALRNQFPQADVRFEDTVCQPTKQRQAAAAELASQCDVVVVVGGAKSNNTRELVGTCLRYCSDVFHVQSSSELRPEWFAGKSVVGLTAGTSTPDVTIDAIEHRLQEFSSAEDRASSNLKPLLSSAGPRESLSSPKTRAPALAA